MMVVDPTGRESMSIISCRAHSSTGRAGGTQLWRNLGFVEVASGVDLCRVPGGNWSVVLSAYIVWLMREPDACRVLAPGGGIGVLAVGDWMAFLVACMRRPSCFRCFVLTVLQLVYLRLLVVYVRQLHDGVFVSMRMSGFRCRCRMLFPPRYDAIADANVFTVPQLPTYICLVITLVSTSRVRSGRTSSERIGSSLPGPLRTAGLPFSDTGRVCYHVFRIGHSTCYPGFCRHRAILGFLLALLDSCSRTRIPASCVNG
ncbi:hypothetical protein F5B21DRAFT_284922 [Xylaria acuta]|nr:hypothetical protein F5B21DRAFT_284922 [Xylaria acuta]